jgi:S-adenosylmethionine:tRNA ribosyltransferase-isomerase
LTPLRTELLDYDLPEHCIAKYPMAARDGARMLVIQSDDVVDSTVRDWPSMVPPGALVVVNDSKVFKARLIGARRPTGGRVELLLLSRAENCVATEYSQMWHAIGRANKSIKVGTVIECPPLTATVQALLPEGELMVCLESSAPVPAGIDQVGHVPIPPYLGRNDEAIDTERYQTIFARERGSVAAPTAGLHLSQSIVQSLLSRDIRIAAVTLHVGVGTFRPVSAPDLDLHRMHEEHYAVDDSLAEEISSARSRKAPVIAVGTTVVRALESARNPLHPGYVVPQKQSTSLLIQPGYDFQIIDGLLTNFHMPQSTLLALVGAFAGLDRTLNAYRTAIHRGYRFLSYGDATWIPQRI